MKLYKNIIRLSTITNIISYSVFIIIYFEFSSFIIKSIIILFYNIFSIFVINFAIFCINYIIVFDN